MIIYPTIELQNGRCVSLYRGRLDEPQIWHVDPVKTAMDFAEAGASRMHITDFDAVSGSDRNEDLICDIMRKAGIFVQVAGGIRSYERAEHWIDKGAARVVVGTIATREPDLVKTLATAYPDQIVLAVDVWQGKVMADGWREVTAFEPADFINEFSDSALAGIIVTDIDGDIEDTDASLALVSRLAAVSRTPVIASGLVRSLDDVARLKYVSNVSGAIVGRALFRKTIDLAEALELAAALPEKTAEFI